MKKVLLCFIMALFTVVTMSAQTVEKSKFFDNTYIGLNTGISAQLHPTCNGFDNFGNSIRSLSSVRLGKMITPIFGVELEGEIGMANRLTFVDHTTVGGNFLFNINNIVHPYRGEADNFEFLPFVGIGWHHTYGFVTNNIVSKFGGQINYNFGNSKEWQFNIIPSINYIMTDNGFSSTTTGQPRFDAHRSFLNLQVGFTYKFKNHDGNHNFTICKFTHTQDEVDELIEQINEQRSLLKAHSENEKLTEPIITKIECIETEPIKKDIPITIGFEIGQSKINKTQKANLIQTAKLIKENDLHVTVVGHADKATGTSERNLALSEFRAKSVADALIQLGVNESNINVEWVGDKEQVFDENDANRVVIFVTE